MEDIIQNIDGFDIANTTAKLYSLESMLKEKQAAIDNFDAEILYKIHADHIDKEIRKNLHKVELFRQGEYR